MSSRKRTPAIGLPNGWVREETVRQSGLSRGKSDVYYFSPSGKKIRSKPELVRHLGHSYDLSNFDYRSGKMVNDKAKLNRRSKPYEAKVTSSRSELNTSQPNRQTASIFKQPVTKKTNHKSNKVKNDQNRGTAKPPQQLFREKRLAGLKAVDIADTIIETMDLPKAIQAVGPITTAEEIIQRIASQLHQASSPITGQTTHSAMKDPCIWLNAQQPICKSFVVTEEDIRKQEFRVLAARRRLEQALKQDTEFQKKELMLLA